MTLIPVEEVDSEWTELALNEGEAALAATGAAFPEWWHLEEAYESVLNIGFAHRESVPEPWGGHNLSVAGLARTTFAGRTRMACMHLVLKADVRTAWVQIVRLEPPLGELYAMAHLGLREPLTLRRGLAVVGGYAGLLKLGPFMVRVTYSNGSPAPLDGGLEAWASNLQADTRDLVVTLGS